MNDLSIQKFNHAQRERLAFIDFCLLFFGQVARADLIQHFQTGLASCSRDLTLYRELAPDNLVLHHKDKQYHRTEQFRPLFNHEAQAALSSLANGFGDGISTGVIPSDVCFDAPHLILPNSGLIAAIMRAIKAGKAIKCHYYSISSGKSQRELVPHALVNNGQRWHVRAFDRKSKSFRDFVCTRFEKITAIESDVLAGEKRDADKAWNKLVTLVLAAHPKLANKTAIEMDYGMQKGRLTLEVREAQAAYLLRHWNVDCTQDASLTEPLYQLHLQNAADLESVVEQSLAPK